jgi:hypothetical protein
MATIPLEAYGHSGRCRRGPGPRLLRRRTRAGRRERDGRQSCATRVAAFSQRGRRWIEPDERRSVRQSRRHGRLARRSLLECGRQWRDNLAVGGTRTPRDGMVTRSAERRRYRKGLHSWIEPRRDLSIAHPRDRCMPWKARLSATASASSQARSTRRRDPARWSQTVISGSDTMSLRAMAVLGTTITPT